MAAKRKKPGASTRRAMTKATKRGAAAKGTGAPRARMPSDPGGDGDGAALILTDYCDWAYGPGEEPTRPSEASAATASRDWAGWVKRKLERQLERQLAGNLPPRKKERLEAALRRVQAWT